MKALSLPHACICAHVDSCRAGLRFSSVATVKIPGCDIARDNVCCPKLYGAPRKSVQRMELRAVFHIECRTVRRYSAPPAGQSPQQFRSLCGHRLKRCLRLCGRRLPARPSSTFTMNAPTGGIHVSIFFTAQERLHIFQKNVLSNKQTGMPAAKARHTVLLR